MTSAQEGTMSFQSTIIADVDVQNIQNPKIRFQVEVSGKNQEDTVDASAEMRILDAVGYMMLKKFSFTPDDEQMSFFIKPYLNIWWSMPLDDVFSQEIASSVEQQTVQNQHIREVLLKKNLIPQLVYKGQQQSSSLYRGIIDNTALVEVIASLAQSQ